MSTANPILNATARLEERLVERWDQWRRDFLLDLDGRFDAVHTRLDRLEQEYEMMRAGMARLEADVTSLSVAVARMERDIASVRGSIDSLEARLRQDHSDRQDLRDQLLDCRRRLGELEERVQAIEGQLPRG